MYIILAIVLLAIALLGIWKEIWFKKKIPKQFAVVLTILYVFVFILKLINDLKNQKKLDIMSKQINEQHNVIMKKDERIYNLERSCDSLQIEMLKIKSKTAGIKFTFEGYEIRGGQAMPYYLYHELEAKVDSIQNKISRGSNEEVIVLCNQLIEEYPFFATPFYYKALAFNNLKLLDSTEVYLRKVISLEGQNKEYALAYLIFAQIRLNSTDFESAKILLDKGINLSYIDSDTTYDRNVQNGIRGGAKRSWFYYYYACYYSLLSVKKTINSETLKDSAIIYLQKAITLEPKLIKNVQKEIAFKSLKTNIRFKNLFK